MPVDRTREFFDAYAGDFDAIYSTRRSPWHRAVNEVLRKSMKLRFLKTVEGCDPIEGRRALDVGCGPGHYAITLARRGASEVVGLDFAAGMIDLAARHAAQAGVADRCRFLTADFLTWEPAARFDYVILMGFMDYMSAARAVVEKAVTHAASRAFFSFPADGGFLAWQRKMRYRNRCDLYLYRREAIETLFAELPAVTVVIERIARDFFVTAHIANE